VKAPGLDVTPVAAVAFGVASAFLFALSNVALRFASEAGSWDIALVRSAVFTMLLAPITLLSPFPNPVRSMLRPWTTLLLFTATTILTTVTWFLGVHALPLATATSLFSLKALFAVLAAAWLMSEKLTKRRLSAVGVGFIGGAILLNPSQPHLLGSALVLCAAATSALSGIFYAQLVRERAPTWILLISSLLQFVGLAPFVLLHTASLPAFTLGMAATSAVLSIGVMYTLAWAYRGADVGVVASLEYLRLPLAAGLAFLFFDERPAVSFFVGSAVIVAGAVLASPRAKRVSRQTGAPAPFRPRRLRE
jgi:drug/metabolite transporter (DMT)-like permease